MTRRITIGGIIFNVEPVGYEILKAYQDAWELDPRGKVKWEEHAAEYLLQMLQGGKSVTTLDHIERMNTQLPEDTLNLIRPATNLTRKKRYLLPMVFGLW